LKRTVIFSHSEGCTQMLKLKLSLDDLAVESFGTVPEALARRGTVKANSGCIYTDADCTQYYSTCDASGGATCDGCLSDANGGCIGLYTYEESYCVCTAEYSCDCAFSEASNCHRC
jgi:hypothetical protein